MFRTDRNITCFDPDLDCILCPGFLKAYSDGLNKWIACSNKGNPCVKEAYSALQQRTPVALFVEKVYNR